MQHETHKSLPKKARRHQRSRAWSLLGRSRCSACGRSWPCPVPRLETAPSTRPATVEWAALATQPNPTVAPLLTYGQRHRSGSWR